MNYCPGCSKHCLVGTLDPNCRTLRMALDDTLNASTGNGVQPHRPHIAGMCPCGKAPHTSYSPYCLACNAERERKRYHLRTTQSTFEQRVHSRRRK
jgi:hypothetical protein